MHKPSLPVPQHTEITYTCTLSHHHSPSSPSRAKSWPTPTIQQRRLALLCAAHHTSLSPTSDPVVSSVDPRHKYMHNAACHSFMLFVFAFSHLNEHQGVALLLNSLIHANQTSINKSPQHSTINSKAWTQLLFRKKCLDSPISFNKSLFPHGTSAKRNPSNNHMTVTLWFTTVSPWEVAQS